MPPEMGLQSVSVEEALQGADLAVIVTAHPGVDHTLIAQRAPAVVDLRGVLRGAAVGIPQGRPRSFQTSRQAGREDRGRQRGSPVG